MRQFDVVANPFALSRERQPFLVNLQSDLLARSLSTVVIAPMQPVGADLFADRLNPIVTFDGAAYAIIVQELVTVRQSALGPTLGSVTDSRDAIIAALDLLFTGI